MSGEAKECVDHVHADGCLVEARGEGEGPNTICSPAMVNEGSRNQLGGVTGYTETEMRGNGKRV